MMNFADIGPKGTAHFDSSESFQYDGFHHRILERLHEGRKHNYWLTISDHAYYIWTSDAEGHMWWECWNVDFNEIMDTWREVELGLPAIEASLYSFMAVDGPNSIPLGTEIKIIPTQCCSINEWRVELKRSDHWETCRFLVYGKRVEWMQRHARLGEELIIALRKSDFQRVVI